MTYEIAQELKDAGFPSTKATPADIESLKEDLFRDGIPGGDWYITPTLAELIDACPTINTADPTETLTLWYHKDGYWLAGYSAFEKWGIAEIGSEPDEAMSRLWIRLKATQQVSAHS